MILNAFVKILAEWSATLTYVITRNGDTFSCPFCVVILIVKTSHTIVQVSISNVAYTIYNVFESF